ncbi:glycosyltransferase family 2 protein [Paenibacillus terrigena]|uniref:glycosyltransferase family 2 protein n=1 Tax=Paenibacillus terrigena TaxID=369333 RepID=UPI00037AECEE|nr:glycosyltransferase [Paenibacillus terrigena]
MNSSLFTIVISVMNQMESTRECVSRIRALASQHIPILIIDNGSDLIHQRELQSLSDYYIHNDHNLGVIPAMNQAWHVLHTPYIMYMHNDIFLMESQFNLRIHRVLNEIGNIGVAGFGGGHSVHCSGVRTSFTSNLLDAEIHGTRMVEDYVPSVVLDGMCLIIRRELILEMGGIAQEYSYHHYYDMDVCLEAIYRGYKVITIGIYHQHVGTQTSSKADYATWLQQKGTSDAALYQSNQSIFREKWGHKSYVVVDDSFNYADIHGAISMKS